MRRLISSSLLLLIPALGMTALAAGDPAPRDSRQRADKPLPSIMLPIFPPLIQTACSESRAIDSVGVPCGRFRGAEAGGLSLSWGGHLDFSGSGSGGGAAGRVPFEAFAPAPPGGFGAAGTAEERPGVTLPADFDFTLISRGGVEFLPPGGTFAGKQAQISLLGAGGGSGLLAPLDGGAGPPVPDDPRPDPAAGIRGRMASVVWLEPAGAGIGRPSILVPVLLGHPYRSAARGWSLD